MPRHDDNEPQRRRNPEGENRPQRPTQDRPHRPTDMPQQGPDYLPAGPNDQPRRAGPTERPRAPELDRATGDETRRAAQGANIPDEMRGYLNHLDRPAQPGDMSDEEARRLAGLDAGNNPEPVEPGRALAHARHDVARVSQAVAAAGTVYPKWHSLVHMPGFQDSQVRGMGQDVFGSITRTPHQNILTISTHTNSQREVEAVKAWLDANAEHVRDLDPDYSGYGQGMGRYKPTITEYSTPNTRFHCVKDKAGEYIYAYPEQDAITPGEQSAQLTHDEPSEHNADEIERDEYGAPIKRLREGTQMKFTSVSEQLRHIANKLNQLEESAALDSILDEAIEDAMLDESTLAKLLGGTVGANELVRALHSRHKLSAGVRKRDSGANRDQVRPGSGTIDPNYEEIPADTKNIAMTIKVNKDNFCIVVGKFGVAGIKPEEKAWDQSRSKERDNTLPYTVVWSTGQGVEQEIAKYRVGRMDATGGTSGAEGGAPNLFQVLRDRIGPVVRAFRATGAVERKKLATRAGYKQDATATVDQVSEKIKPVLQKLLQSTVGQLGPRINRLSGGNDYEGAEKLIRAGKKLQAMLVALDSPSPEWTGWRTPLGTYGELIRNGIRELTQGMDDAGRAQFMNNAASGQANELGQLLNYLRAKLFTVSE